MKKIIALSLFVCALLLTSCFEDRDDNIIQTSSIKDFVWKGMNFTYLYKSNIPDLADNRFSSNNEYAEYLNGFSSPEDLFESLKYLPETVDRFSRIWPNYFDLEQRLQGIFKTNGMEFSLYAAPNSDTDLVGIVRLVLPNSDADTKGLKRGDIFGHVNGTTLTRSNYVDLLTPDTYTVNLGEYDDKGTPETSDDSIETIGTDIALEKFEYTEDPIYISDIFQVGGENVGYLMYNAFTTGSETELNTVFANFKSNNIQHLVLDLRYNPGGSVATTTYLASMITGQFTGEVFERLIYNENLQNNNTDYDFTNTLNGNALNSLGLTKIYIIATNSSASASEGIMNGLAPYIEVIHIGENTVGKTQASSIFYDSEDFGRQGANPAHTYVIQPLIANGVNKNNESVPGTGLVPTIGFEYEEKPLELGVLGDINEPLLAIALADIENSTGKIRFIKSKPQLISNKVSESNDFLPFEKGGMIAD